MPVLHDPTIFKFANLKMQPNKGDASTRQCRGITRRPCSSTLPPSSTVVVDCSDGDGFAERLSFLGARLVNKRTPSDIRKQTQAIFDASAFKQSYLRIKPGFQPGQAVPESLESDFQDYAKEVLLKTGTLVMVHIYNFRADLNKDFIGDCTVPYVKTINDTQPGLSVSTFGLVYNASLSSGRKTLTGVTAPHAHEAQCNAIVVLQPKFMLSARLVSAEEYSVALSPSALKHGDVVPVSAIQKTPAFNGRAVPLDEGHSVLWREGVASRAEIQQFEVEHLAMYDAVPFNRAATSHTTSAAAENYFKLTTAFETSKL